MHLFLLDLHNLIGLNCHAKVKLTLDLSSLFPICLFEWVKDLVIQLDLVLQALSTAIEKSDSLFLLSVDGNLWLFRLKGPRLLIIDHFLDMGRLELVGGRDIKGACSNRVSTAINNALGRGVEMGDGL